MSKRYVYNNDLNIYEQVKTGKFAYSDGDAVENFLYTTIKNASDVSTGSDELTQHISDWATLYHLSSARSNLLRPIEANLKGKRVLELGSGCGAISRFLGESGCELSCVEGSSRRASITAARCRGLKNVKVYNDNFQCFESDQLFDVVTLIGVLEYSRKFIKGEDPIAAALALARSFLKPDGVLILAIENKLGLKYWAGAFEDHIGVPFYGVESLYGADTAVTFGKKELARLLRRSEFGDLEFYYPYPDYKLPGMVLSELIEDADPMIANNLLSASFAPTQTVNYVRTLSEGATYRALIENGLLGDFANSFLVIAKKGQGNWQRNRNDLAFTYSNGRRKALSKEVKICDVEGATAVQRRLLYATKSPDWMSFAKDESLKSGELLFNELLPIINREGWSADHLVVWLKPLFQVLIKKSRQVGRRRVLPGHFYDASPFNLVGEKGSFALFDLEWSPWPEIDLNLSLFRGLFHSLARIGSVVQPSEGTPTSLASLSGLVVEHLTGVSVDIDAYLAKEVEFQRKVMLFTSSVEGLKNSQLNIRMQPTRLRQALIESQKALTKLRADDGDGSSVSVSSNPTQLLQNWLQARLPTEVQHRLIDDCLSRNKGGPKFCIVILDLTDDRVKLTASIKSLRVKEDIYKTIKIVVMTQCDSLDDLPESKVHFVKMDPQQYVATLNQVIADSAADWVMVANAGDEFTASGLMIASLELIASPGCRAIYGDEMLRLADGSLGPLFRPSFNLDLLLSFPASMARHWLFRRDAFVEVGGFDSCYGAAIELDLILRLVESGGMQDLGHVSEPLLITQAPALQNCQDERAAIARHLAARDYPRAQVGSDLPGRYRINYGHKQQPLVSILIPTKDQLPILRRCVESVLENTRYENYEILIVDNNSESPEALEWLASVEAMAEDKIRVLRYPQPFNFSAINNMAARVARGDYLVLLNNDTAAISSDWLDALLNHAQRPEVGIVGAKLLYPDGRIQHAGVVLGLSGPADHPFIGEPVDAAGYMQRLQVDQNYSAVTAACLMIRKSVYLEVGGMDEEHFKVSYNDVDLCLKTRELGYLTVWTPHAVLMHEGGVSQKKVDQLAAQAKRKRFVAEQDAMYAKWLPLLARDPAYNANFSLAQPGGFKLADTQISWRPLDSWRPLPVVLAHPADQFGCGHYRVMQPFSAQQEAGLIDGALSVGLMHVTDLERYNPDVVILQRQIGEDRLEAMRRMKAFSRAFKVYELDDYLPNLPMKNAHREHMPKDIVRSLRRGLSFVDRFVVATEALAEAFAGMHEDIRVMENRLPVQWWQGLAAQRRTTAKPRVGWAGGVSHTGDLEMIADVVKALADEVDWVFFGMCPAALRPYMKEVHVGVEIGLYPQALAGLNLDLALAPVEQNLFNECKSNLRLLEYGACGFPVICSDIRCYAGDFPVTRVKNRFKDWVEAIRMHLADLDATARMGDELRAVVRSEWMLEGRNLEAWRTVWLPD